MRMSSNRKIIEKCKAILADHYGERFAGLYLYGSVARRQDVPGSDIDLLVLLEEPFDFFKELRTMIELLYAVQLRSDQLISAKPVLRHEFEAGKLHFYRTIQREGVAA